MLYIMQHSPEVYFRLAKKLAYDDEVHKVKNEDIPNEYLCPSIERVKIITQCGNEAIVVVTGQQLWFVHSVKLCSESVVEEPFQVQECSVSFKTKTENVKIPTSQEEREIVIYSYFDQPVQKKLHVELEVSFV